MVHAEMQRCMKLLEHQALRWESAHDQSEQVTLSPVLLEGMRAYADSQATVNRALASSFQTLWLRNTSEVEWLVNSKREALEWEEEEELVRMDTACDMQIE